MTIGLLRILDRDELQGVVAHEIGHIKNRDVALMTTAGIMLGAIVLLAEIGRARAVVQRRRHASVARRHAAAARQAIIMIVALVLMILAPIFAQLIYFALSRRREYLADASGRDVHPLAGRAGLGAGEARRASAMPQADQSRVTAPMYIVRPLRPGQKRSFTSAFSTHPPLGKRVEILRQMAGGAGIHAYDAAYRQVTGRRGHVVGRHDLEAAGVVPIQSPALTRDATRPTERLREASDAYLAGAHYERKPCSSCGAILKVPPQLKGHVKACPRCDSPL